MLDQETKRKIDSARQILVGKVPDPKQQVDQITNALIYKFMDDMDKENEEVGLKAQFFVDDWKKFSWTKLLDNKLSGQERLDLYVQAITNMSKNPHIPQLFRDIFKGAFLPYNDPRTLSLFLKEINEFNYEHSENLGNAFEYLLSILGSQGDAGQFRTPRHIIDFIVEVVDPKKNETILDPACGTAGFLIAAYKHILKTNKEKPLTPDEKLKLMNNLAGYDISPDMVKLALVNMYLHRFPEPKIHEYDSLTSEKRWDETFDVILANPPFMTPKGGIEPHAKFSIRARRAEVLFVDYIIEHLNIGGRAGIIVPEGIIFQTANAYKALRKKLVEDGLVAVISLPSGVFNPYSGVKTSILLFDSEIAKRADNLLFVKITNDGFDLGAQRREIDKNDLPVALEIIKKYRETLSDEDFTEAEKEIALVVSREKITESGDYNLTGERYREVETFTNQKWPMVELGEVVEIQNGLWKGKKPPFVKAKVLRNTNFIKKTGALSFDDVAEIDVEKRHFEKRELINGDIILENSGGSPTQPVGRVAYFGKNLKGFSYSNFTSRIRVLDKNICDSKYLWAILLNFYKSGKTEVLQSQTSGIKNLDKKGYLKLKIPLPPLSVQKEIVEKIEVKQKAIDSAKEVIRNLERERAYFGESLRRIEGIEWVELGEVAEVIAGQSPEGKYYNENGEGIPFYQGKTEFTKIYLGKPKKWTSKITKVAERNDILMSVRAPVGPVNIATEKICIGRGIASIRAKGIDKMFLFYFLKSIEDKIRGGGGAVFDSINKKQIEELKIPLPPLEIQQKLVAEAEEEQKIIYTNKRLIEIMERKIEKVLSEI